MNVKLVYANRIESWDTRADGSATTSRAALEVSDSRLVLWSALSFDGAYDDDGRAIRDSQRTEKGCPAVIADLGENAPSSLPEFMQAMGERDGLLRIDVDGETIWEAAGVPEG